MAIRYLQGHIIDSTLLRGILICFVEKLEASGDAGRSRFLKAMEYCEEYGKKLIKGDITVEELKIITSNKSKFCQILSAIKHLSASQASSNEEMLMEAISKRIEEEKFVTTHRTMVQTVHTHLIECSGSKICKYEHKLWNNNEAVALSVVLSLIQC